MPAEHCEVSELIETMDSSELSAQSVDCFMSLKERKNSLDYMEHQMVNEKMYPAVHSSDHCNMNGEDKEDGKTPADYIGQSVGFGQCVNAACEDIPALHKQTIQCKSSELNKSFEECTQHCEWSEFSKSSEHSATDCLAAVFSPHCECCTQHFRASEQCLSSDQHCMSFDPREHAEFFDQCNTPAFIPGVSECTESIRSTEKCTGISEDFENSNVEHQIDCNENKNQFDKISKPSVPSVQQIEICGLFDSEFCIILQPVHSSDLNVHSQHYAEQVVHKEHTHVSEVHEPTEQTLLDEQSSQQSAEYDIPLGHCELQNNLFELRETSVQCEQSERCNSCESCPGQHHSIYDICCEPSRSFYSEEDKYSECSSIETRSFESFTDDEALIKEESLDKSSDDQSEFCSDIWESFSVLAEGEESNAAEDKPHLDEIVVVEELFGLFDKDNSYTFAQRQPYTSCFEGGGVHELIFEQQKPCRSIMNDEETYTPFAKKGLEPLSVVEIEINDICNKELEEVDETYYANAEDRHFNVECVDDDASASDSFVEEESCESCFEEATTYRDDVYEAFLANNLEAEAHEHCLDEDKLYFVEEKAANVQDNGPLWNEDMFVHKAEEDSHESSSDVSSIEYDEAYEGQNNQTYEPCPEEQHTCAEINEKVCISTDELDKPYTDDKASGLCEQCDEDCYALLSGGEDKTLCIENKACDRSTDGQNQYEIEVNGTKCYQEASGIFAEEGFHAKDYEGKPFEGTHEPIVDEVCTEEGEHDARCDEESESPQSFEVLSKGDVLYTEGSKPAMPDGIEFNGDQTDSSTTSSEEIDEQNKSSDACDDLNTPYLSENWEEHNGISEHFQTPELQDLLSDDANHSKNSIDTEPTECYNIQTECSKQNERDGKTEYHAFFKIVASEQPSEDSEEELSDDESSESCECEFCIPPKEQVPAKPLLPQIKSKDAGKICVVLDLDETLVHSSFKPVNNADFIIPVEIDGTIHQVYVLKRPHVDEYLKRMGELFECVLFTASLSKYADPVSDLLDKCGAFHHRLFRESCVFHRGNYVKDLSRLGRDINKVVIVDNSPASYIFHPENAVPVASWFDDMADTELLDLIPFFERLSKVDNVYDILKQQRTAS
ncbi:hypothetical protein UPYG_G00318060 [Umbra pygmaea]|uniref:protein-serine/threonine phosphatase n=1 Tax=Umbra pygmaea TaxID=75934 RepID=A0ABD0W027_UMBPY